MFELLVSFDRAAVPRSLELPGDYVRGGFGLAHGLAVVVVAAAVAFGVNSAHHWG